MALDAWVAGERRYAATAMLASVSPVAIVKTRPGFGQTIRPLPGAIVASPVLASYDPEPDYFFHWYRDAAIVVDALRALAADPAERPVMCGHVRDYVAFSLRLAALDGRELNAAPDWRGAVAAPMQQFVRPAAELEQVHGDRVAGEVRVNPDATLDITRWSRPQHDGVALRALTLLRWASSGYADAELCTALAPLVSGDLAYVSAHCSEPCFGIWEEAQALHYYTLSVTAGALDEGAHWLERRGEALAADRYRRQVADILTLMDGCWDETAGYYRASVSGGTPGRDLDIAVILAALHSGRRGPTHSVCDPRMVATLRQLERLFDRLYPLNRNRPVTQGPALGRYAEDQYFSGGAYYFSTLGAAEFWFRAAAASAEPAECLRRGDACLETVRAYTPPGGELSEQFDKTTGMQTSARHLAWSYAAFILCTEARTRAQASFESAFTKC